MKLYYCGKCKHMHREGSRIGKAHGIEEININFSTIAQRAEDDIREKTDKLLSEILSLIKLDLDSDSSHYRKELLRQKIKECEIQGEITDSVNEVFQENLGNRERNII